VLVVEKKLVLREEVHVKRVRKEVHDSREVTLREERVEVARRPSNNQRNNQGSIQDS
jgi:stress response protein YsnF